MYIYHMAFVHSEQILNLQDFRVIWIESLKKSVPYY